MSKYDNLRRYLMEADDEEIYLSYDEITTLLRDSLPPSAYKWPEQFWANTKGTRGDAWLSAGYEVEMATDTTECTPRYVMFVKR